MEAEEPAEEPTTLHKLRNMWQFANLAQYLHNFIDALRVDKDFDIEVCLHCAGHILNAADSMIDRADAEHATGPRIRVFEPTGLGKTSAARSCTA
jgi:hypothetical protein